MWRLHDLDEHEARGLPVDEVRAHDAAREALVEELGRLEAKLGAAEADRLRRDHERDRAYWRQLHEMESEGRRWKPEE
jgi:hypothetical protein